MTNSIDSTPRPREAQGNPDKVSLYLWLLLLCAFAFSSSIWYAIATKTAGTLDRIDRLEIHGAEITARVVDLHRRVLALERPDRSVFPPGHPGRIGTTFGTELSPQFVPPRPGSAGRGAGGEGPTAPPAPPPAKTDPEQLRDA